ncbi:MAG: nitronate monooxygenase [Desulfobacterales bacterium]|nr:nitronate monooxygenase [Desulfobacterales bacterium]
MLVKKFFDAGRKFLECEIPIMCGAMTWVSDYKLVGAIGNAGGLGFLPGGNASVEVLGKEILATREYMDKPFGVNLITLAPVYPDQVQLASDLRCKVVMFAGSIPKESEIRKVQDAGAKVICFAPTAPLALRLIKMGTDALMLEGSEAGGHIGPVSLTVLLQQILYEVDTVPIFVAGGIATGRMMAHLLMMGAAGIQMGTRFVMSEECSAHPKFKDVFRKAKAKDATATPQFDSRLPVIPVRALKNEGTIEFGKLQLELLNKLDNQIIDREEAQFEVEQFWVDALKEATVNGDIVRGSLMAGQSVGLVSEIKPLKGIIDEMVQDAEAELQRLKNIIS